MLIPTKTKIKDINKMWFTPVLSGFTKEECLVEIEMRELPIHIINRYHTFIRHHTHKPIFVSQLIQISSRYAVLPADYAFSIIGFNLDNSDYRSISTFELYNTKIDVLRSMYYNEGENTVRLPMWMEFPNRNAPCQFTQLWHISKTFIQFLWFPEVVVGGRGPGPCQFG